MIYILFLLVFILTILSENRLEKGVNFSRFFVACLYIFLIGLRGINIGKDTENYFHHFYTFGKYGCDFVEPGFDFINRFCYSQGWLPYSYTLICACLSVLPVCYYMFKLDHREYSITAFLFYTASFVTLCNGMRQCIAVGFVFGLLYYVNEHNFNRKTIIIYVLGVLVSSLFHVTALLMLPLVATKKLHLSNKLCIFIYILSFVFVFVDLTAYIPLLNFELGDRNFSHYLEDAKRTEGSVIGMLIVILLNVGIFVMMLKSNSFKKYSFISNLAFLHIILVNVGCHITMIPRLNLYFSWFVYFAVANAFTQQISRNEITVLAKMSVILLYLMIIMNSYISPSNMLLPYQFFWEN